MRILLLLAVCSAAPASWAHAQTAGERSARTRIDLELASEEMRRYPSISTSAGQLANRGADAALDRLFGVPEGTGARAVLHRILRTYFISLPIAALSATAAHELGHVSRGHEGGLSFSAFHIAQWPWPVPAMSARLQLDTSGTAPSAVNELSAIAGGAEGARVQEDGLLDQIYSGRTTNYFNWLLLGDAKLEMPLYTWNRDARVGDPGQFSDEFAFIRAAVRFRPDAPGLYFVPTDVERIAAWRTARHGMWLNLIDYSLGAAVFQTLKYVRTGNRETPVPALRRRSMAIVPALRFSMTSQGFERGVDVRAIMPRIASHAALRWTDTPAGDRLWAGEIELRGYRISKWQPRVRLDVFERTTGPLEFSHAGVGSRMEAGACVPLRVSRHPVNIGVRLGYKTRGYLSDTPERATVLGGVSFGVRF